VPFFTDILFAQVCGAELDQCIPWYDRYCHSSKENPESLPMVVASDIVTYVTRSDSIPPGSMIVVCRMLHSLTVNTAMITANAFGDPNTVAKLQADFDAVTP
jgi:hypothetical protein